jgi:hypothetical protein
MVVRKVGPFTFEEMHAALFPGGPPGLRTKAERDVALTCYFKSK